MIGIVAFAGPGAADDSELRMSVTPEVITIGESVEVRSIDPCIGKELHRTTVVDIEVWKDDELLATDSVVAFAPDDPAQDGSWSWTFQTSPEGEGGQYSVQASCFLLDTDTDPAKPIRILVGTYGKVDFSTELDAEAHPPDPTGPPRPSEPGDVSLPAPPIGSGITELGTPSEPPAATPVPGRPNFTG